MTSFIIKSHEDRRLPLTWTQDPDCAFCRILKGEIPSATLYEDDKVIAILDIMPLRRGHTLVIPKVHISRLSELPPDYAASVGKAISKVAHALTGAVDNTGLNVVCNQEYAQAVPHVHYHIIPAPKLGGLGQVADTESKKPAEHLVPLTHREMHQKEFEAREELDDDDAVVLVKAVRARL